MIVRKTERLKGGLIPCPVCEGAEGGCHACGNQGRVLMEVRVEPTTVEHAAILSPRSVFVTLNGERVPFELAGRRYFDQRFGPEMGGHLSYMAGVIAHLSSFLRWAGYEIDYEDPSALTEEDMAVSAPLFDTSSLSEGR